MKRLERRIDLNFFGRKSQQLRLLLNVAGVAENITAEGDAATLVETSKSAPKWVIDEQQLKDLPVLSQTFYFAIPVQTLKQGLIKPLPADEIAVPGEDRVDTSGHRRESIYPRGRIRNPCWHFARGGSRCNLPYMRLG